MASVVGNYFTLMRKLVATQCPCQCECPSLRSVSYAVGGFNVFLSALFTIRVLVHLAIYNHLESQLPHLDEVERDDFKIGVSTLLLMLALGFAWLFSSLLLIKGIYQERFKLMSWWIYLNYFAMAVIFGTAAVAFIADCIYWSSFHEVFGKLVLYSLGSGLSFLIFFPVFKLYKRMRINSEQQALKESEAYMSCLPAPNTRVKEFYESERLEKQEHKETQETQEYEY